MGLQVAADQCNHIKVMFLSSTDIRANSTLLESRWKRALPIPAIQKQHVFKMAGIHELYISRYASESPLRKCRVLLTNSSVEDVDEDPVKEQAISPPTPVMSVAVGDWVLVRYDNSTYPGEVKVLKNQEVEVSVMVPSGSGFKWPKPADCIPYRMENVIRKLQPPTPHFTKSSRGTFVFADIPTQL